MRPRFLPALSRNTERTTRGVKRSRRSSPLSTTDRLTRGIAVFQQSRSGYEMAKRPLLYCATDKELFDVLMSSKQHFGERTLLNLARNRGILCSFSDDRIDLADKLSLMIFGHHEILAIQDEFE